MAKIHPRALEAEGLPSSNIWIIGEFPDEDSVYGGKQFTGRAGELLISTLERAGIARSDCFITNTCKYCPTENNYSLLEGSRELSESQQELALLLRGHSPNVVVCVGEESLRFITGLEGITNWRGSILDGNLFNSSKTIPIIKPYFVLRDGANYPVLELDCNRIKEESRSNEVRLPHYSMVLDPTGDILEQALHEILTAKIISVDIETVIYTATLRCIGFAIRPDRCFVLRLDSHRKREVIKLILEASVPKVLQNGIFDTLILEENGYTVSEYTHDTLIAQHILNPELPRGLDFLASVYTRQPYWKHTSKDDVLKYNGIDACVTLDIALQQIKELEESGLQRLFLFEMSEVEMAREISKTGLPIDMERRSLFSKLLNAKYEEQAKLFIELVGLKGVEYNPNSTHQVQAVVYDAWKLPEKKSRTSGNRTLDEDAVVSLIAYTKDKRDTSVRTETKTKYEMMYYALKILLELRGLKKLISSYIDITLSPDGRARSMFKTSSVETGRWASEKYYDNTGWNGQTLPRESIEVGG